MMEAKLVAEKSAKIRDWVSHKVQEVAIDNVCYSWLFSSGITLLGVIELQDLINRGVNFTIVIEFSSLMI